jgi:hypothetical protein
MLGYWILMYRCASSFRVLSLRDKKTTKKSKDSERRKPLGLFSLYHKVIATTSLFMRSKERKPRVAITLWYKENKPKRRALLSERKEVGTKKTTKHHNELEFIRNVAASASSLLSERSVAKLLFIMDSCLYNYLYN